VRPRLLLLGGIDPSGGAGLTVDAVVAAMHGCLGLPVVTAWTVQNRHRFDSRSPLPPDQLAAALAAALEDGAVDAVKIGMLGSAATVAFVASALRPLVGRVPIVIDPVLVSTVSGLSASTAMAAAYLEHLLPIASVLLPNHAETAAICGERADAALASGCAAVLAKDGHGEGAIVDDVLWRRDHAARHFRRSRLAVGPVRGTGCALATAVAAQLAGGLPLETACQQAGDWLHLLLQELGPAPVDGLPRLLPLAGAPWVSRTSK
jgi:hydroxymethylpyrimidine/phosphomethylpyrimidine kinase